MVRNFVDRAPDGEMPPTSRCHRGTRWSASNGDRATVPQRGLGADLTELPGSHSSFFSRPEALTDVLLRIADG